MSKFQKFFAVLLLCLFAGGVYLRHAEPLGPHSAKMPLTAVVVEDSAHRTPTIGAVISAAEVLAVVKEKQIAWHVVDQAESGPDLAEVQWAIAAAKNKPLPALVLRAGGAKAKILPLPATAATLAATLRAAAGH